jgi:hypothetical protein
MAKRPRPVKDIDDAMTWLSFMARFTDGDLRRNCAGILDVLVQMDLHMEELRSRCSALAQRNERLEAGNEKGDGL